MTDMFQQLRLGNPRVSHQAHVHVPPDLEPVMQIQACTPNHLEQQNLLDVFVAPDLWSYAACQAGVHIALLQELVHHVSVLHTMAFCLMCVES
jgi:hypothetical protein